MTISEETHKVLFASQLKGFGPAALRKMIATGGTQPKASFEVLLQASIRDVHEDDIKEAEVATGYQVEQADNLGARILSPFDSEYPDILFLSPEYPPLLWVKGTLAPNPQKSVAVIGPREATRHGMVIAHRISRYLVNQGWSVVSGLAMGCDSVAHKAALDAGGHTVAVLAHGLQMVSPSQNKNLAQRILDEGGALVSEFPIGNKPIGHQFVQRDRTQAGLSQGVVMVQSDLKGGSLHAPRAALSYNRWIAVPSPTEDDLSVKAEKIKANLLLLKGAMREKARLMRCEPEAFERMIILESKDDYVRLITDNQITHSPGLLRQHALL